MTDEKDYSKSQCEYLAARVGNPSDLPTECWKFWQTDGNTAEPHKGLSPGDAAAAASSRNSGSLNQAQLQRRMTTRSRHTRNW